MDDYDQFDAEFSNDMDFDYGPPPMPTSRNDRYGNAYGNYRGGYGPGGDYGPPRFGLRPAPPPPPVWGAGYGPRGPPAPARNGGGSHERAYRYLLRCGVAKESLKNVPNDLFDMISPQFCGLCGMDLPDFNISRVHYSSKNHMKSQKKWLSKRIDGLRGNEAPLKARELYCELCDVQITSKAHADSHYAGKPHRSIVEGRKVPKNPVLLQRNMSARLQQLIRREKKCLKNIEEKQPVEEAVKKNEEKPIDPELYCEICKTSVTCSEQMTMHLNGKRHLTKEKRHIFDMMKGEASGQGAADETLQDDDGNDGDQQDDSALGDADQTGENGDQTGENAGETGANEEAWTEDWNDNTGGGAQ